MTQELQQRLCTIIQEREVLKQNENISQWWTEIPLEVRQKVLSLSHAITQDPNKSFEDLFPEDVVQIGKFLQSHRDAQEEDVNTRKTTKADLDDVMLWWETLNQSQRQHSIDPQQLYDWSLHLSQTEWDKMLPRQRIETIRAFGFRHEDKDISKIIGFDASPEKPETWWNLFNSSMRQHVIDPHKQFWWSLRLAKIPFEDLDDDEKNIVTKTYSYRHGEGDKEKEVKEMDEGSMGWWDDATPEDRSSVIHVNSNIASKPWDQLTPEQKIRLRQVILARQNDYAEDEERHELKEYSKFLKDWKFHFHGNNQPHKLLESPDHCIWKSVNGKRFCVMPGETLSGAYKRMKAKPGYVPKVKVSASLR